MSWRAPARQLYHLGETLSAAEALALGLVNWIVPDEDFRLNWRN